jgi:hypothetical protein
MPSKIGTVVTGSVVILTKTPRNIYWMHFWQHFWRYTPTTLKLKSWTNKSSLAVNAVKQNCFRNYKRIECIKDVKFILRIQIQLCQTTITHYVLMHYFSCPSFSSIAAHYKLKYINKWTLTRGQILTSPKKENLEGEVSLKLLPHNDNALPFARRLSCYYFTAKRHKTHKKCKTLLDVN